MSTQEVDKTATKRSENKKSHDENVEKIGNVMSQGSDTVLMKELAIVDAPDNVSVDVVPNADEDTTTSESRHLNVLKRYCSLTEEDLPTIPLL